MMAVALVTGPGSGIGRATAIGLGQAGHHVIAAGRYPERIEPVMHEVTAAGGSAEYLELDLTSIRSVREAARRVIGSGPPVDVLVNNAGIGVNRRGLTEDGFEVHFGINHLGHFLLTRDLAPVLSTGARVISLTSGMHHRANGIDFERVRRPTRLIGLAEYSTSKLANVLFIRELARRRPELSTYAVHPGLVRTGIIPGFVRALSGSSMLTPEQGADTVIWCATSDEVTGDTGHYYQQRARLAPSPVAQSNELARELWERSDEWCG
jgi:NAD(P)-dependent dehydrogenase (short-subunit alcohol dehydrogenase family)